MSTSGTRIKLTTRMLRIIREHGPRMSDEDLAALLRDTIGPDLWTATRVRDVRKRHGIKRAPDYVLSMRAPAPYTGAPDGTVRLMKHGGEMVPHIRVAPSKWRPYRIYVWEQANGPLPKGWVVTHKDGDAHNCDLSNLEAVPRAEMMRRMNARRAEWIDSWREVYREGCAKYLEEQRRKKAAEIYLAHKPYEFAS